MKNENRQSNAESLIALYGIRAYFDTKDLEFDELVYDSGSLIASPDKPLEHVLFLMQGAVRIYGIRADGSLSHVNRVCSPALLGDIEFVSLKPTAFYVEAIGKCTCLALPIKRYKSKLDHDVRFLHLLLSSLTDKFMLSDDMNILSSSLEEKLLFYFKTIWKNSEISGIEAATQQLRCSRRQLQRVLHKLLEEGRIEKLGKGRYRLKEQCLKTLQ